MAATGGSSSVGGGESEALRCERGAPPQSPPQRRATPRPPCSGAPASPLPTRPSGVHRPFGHLPCPAAQPPPPPLSLHPSGDCGAPTRRGWGAGCSDRGAPRRPGGSDPPAPAPPHSPLGSPRPSAPLPRHAETPRPGRPPPPVSRRRSRQAGGGPGGRGRGRGGAARPEPGARSPALEPPPPARLALVARDVHHWGKLKLLFVFHF